MTIHLRTRFAALSLVLGAVVAGCADESPTPRQTPPAEIPLSGSYSSTIPAGDFKGEPAAPPDVLRGEWLLYLGAEYRLEQERFGRDSGTLVVTENELVFIAKPAPEGTFNCFDRGKRTSEEGNGRYSYEMTGSTLELRAVDEPCPLREILLARTWQRL